MAKPFKRALCHRCDDRAGWQLSELPKCLDPGLVEPLDLRLVDIGNLVQVIVIEPLLFAYLAPVARVATCAGFGVCGLCSRAIDMTRAD